MAQLRAQAELGRKYLRELRREVTRLAMLADESLLRRGFAVFLLLIGLRQLFPGKPKKKKTGPEA